MIRKAVIPVAGLGTRMLPATKAIPKEMLPIADKPLIQYIVEECAAAGIKDVILVTHSSKNSIENHFDTSFELEATLEKRVKRQLLDEVQAICPPGINIMHVRQGVAKGLGHAIFSARRLVGDEAFAVVLPDVLIDNAACDLHKDNLAEMVDRFDATGISQIMVETVPEEDVNNYGVVDIDGYPLAIKESVSIKAIVEKPAVVEAPSNFAVVGRYVFSADLWAILEETPPGVGDEIQLTDAIDMMMKEKEVQAYYMKGKSHDCGNKLDYMKAFVEYSRRHEEFGAEFEDFLRSIYL